MLSEADLIAKRAALGWLAKPHPQGTHQDLADALSLSRSWVSTWVQRLHQAAPAEIVALHSRSRARHTPPASIASQPAVVQRILEIRLAPPETLQRVRGPEAILYSIHRDPTLHQAGVRLPPPSSAFSVRLLRSGGLVHRPATLAQVVSAHRDGSGSFHPAASQAGALLRHPTAACGLPSLADLARGCPDRRDFPLARAGPSASRCADPTGHGPSHPHLPGLRRAPTPGWKAGSAVG